MKRTETERVRDRKQPNDRQLQYDAAILILLGILLAFVLPISLAIIAPHKDHVENPVKFFPTANPTLHILLTGSAIGAIAWSYITIKSPRLRDTDKILSWNDTLGIIFVGFAATLAFYALIPADFSQNDSIKTLGLGVATGTAAFPLLIALRGMVTDMVAQKDAKEAKALALDSFETTLNGLAVSYYFEGRTALKAGANEDARAYFMMALRPAEENIDYQSFHGNLGLAYYYSENNDPSELDFDKALTFIDKAISVAEQKQTPSAIRQEAGARAYRGFILSQLGRTSEEEAELQLAIRGFDKSGSDMNSIRSYIEESYGNKLSEAAQRILSDSLHERGKE